MSTKIQEQQLANAVELERDDARPNLADVWEVLDTPVYCVVDEDGVNVAGGKIRRLDRRAWLYVDDTDGYSVMPEADVANLIAVPEDKHVALGWDQQGNVIEL